MGNLPEDVAAERRLPEGQHQLADGLFPLHMALPIVMALLLSFMGLLPPGQEANAKAPRPQGRHHEIPTKRRLSEGPRLTGGRC